MGKLKGLKVDKRRTEPSNFSTFGLRVLGYFSTAAAINVWASAEIQSADLLCDGAAEAVGERLI